MRNDRLRPLADPVDDDDSVALEELGFTASAQQVAGVLRQGVPALEGASGSRFNRSFNRSFDRSFDRFLPDELRIVSGQHWTPLVVALRVAEWLDGLGVRRVVDLGSGAGKFCVAAAIASSCQFTGIEQRPHLVHAARALARSFAVEDRVRFIVGTLGQLEIPDADAYYLYNPFGENLFGPEGHVDDVVELSEERYMRDTSLVERFLKHAPVGTYVVKYNGFGGIMPGTYKPIRIDHGMPNVLRLWRKTSSYREAQAST